MSEAAPVEQIVIDDFLSLADALKLGRETLITPKNIVRRRILPVSIPTLTRWRSLGVGPAYVKLSRSKVAYTAGAIADTLAAKRIAAG